MSCSPRIRRISAPDMAGGNSPASPRTDASRMPEDRGCHEQPRAVPHEGVGGNHVESHPAAVSDDRILRGAEVKLGHEQSARPVRDPPCQSSTRAIAIRAKRPRRRQPRSWRARRRTMVGERRGPRYRRPLPRLSPAAGGPGWRPILRPSRSWPGSTLSRVLLPAQLVSVAKVRNTYSSRHLAAT
jgi:hypothetical protein